MNVRREIWCTGSRRELQVHVQVRREVAMEVRRQVCFEALRGHQRPLAGPADEKETACEIASEGLQAG